jgi:GH25 family lysozyme M1 (1,4-beta-N-acetylmuramidase)
MTELIMKKESVYIEPNLRLRTRKYKAKFAITIRNNPVIYTRKNYEVLYRSFDGTKKTKSFSIRKYGDKKSLEASKLYLTDGAYIKQN